MNEKCKMQILKCKITAKPWIILCFNLSVIFTEDGKII